MFWPTFSAFFSLALVTARIVIEEESIEIVDLIVKYKVKIFFLTIIQCLAFYPMDVGKFLKDVFGDIVKRFSWRNVANDVTQGSEHNPMLTQNGPTGL